MTRKVGHAAALKNRHSFWAGGLTAGNPAYSCKIYALHVVVDFAK
jgi:hypothetical protein